MSAEILSALLAANLAASAAILLVVVVRKAVRRMIGGRLAYWLWAVPVLAGMATLLPARPEGGAAPAAPIQPIAEATVNLATTWAAPNVSHAPAALDVGALLVGLWAAGALCFLMLMLLLQHQTLRSLKLGRAQSQGQVSRRAVSNFGPAVVGVLRPLLVVPADFEQRFSSAEQDLVLAHERAHLAAGHTRINAALVLLTSLSWFNPLVHWAARLARIDQELACDAAVIDQFPGARGAYAEALLKTQISQSPLPLGCTWPSQSSRFFKERMTMLANRTPGRARRMVGAGFIAVTLLGTGLAAWAQKPPALPDGSFAFAGATASVSRDGNVLWNGQLVNDRDALAEQARKQVASGVPHIRLSADTGTLYMNVGQVIETAQKMGMKDITFLPSGVVFVTPTPPSTDSAQLHIVALREASIEIRGADGTKFLARSLARGESYMPRVGAGWTVTTSDGSAFEWRLGNVSLGLVAPAGPVNAQSVDLALKRTPDAPDPIRVIIDFDGSIYWNGHLVDAAALERNLKDAAAQKTPPEIHVEPHMRATFDRVAQVLVATKQAGLKKFVIIGGTAVILGNPS